MAEEKIHIGVYAVAKRGNKIALILKGRGPYTGMLDLPGGKIEYGESVEDCLKREILEELGAEVKKFKLWKVVQNSISYQEGDVMINLQHVGIIFEVEIDGEIVSRAEHDVVEAGWYEIDYLDRGNLTFLAEYGINGGSY